jgi:cytochrome c peroxidase
MKRFRSAVADHLPVASLALGCAAVIALACSSEPSRAPAAVAAAPAPASAPAAAEPQAPSSSPQSFRPEVLPLPADPAAYEPLERYAAMEIPADNPLTAGKAALGRQLYYDTRLSGDLARSCYSCHVCEKGLTDGRALALGAFDKPLTRSAPTMWNVGFHQNWYWDGRAKTLEAQALAAWKGANMGADPDKVVAALEAVPGYAEQFRTVFGGPATPDAVAAALAAYMRTIVGGKTPWDRWQAGDEAAVTDAAKRGWEVFQQSGCSGCHTGALFTDLQFHNIGIGMGAAEPDIGRFKVTSVERDKGAFKTPTLRDIAQSAPYFHDGSVATLEDAVKLVLAGGIDNPWKNTDKLKPVTLAPQQFSDLIEFLKSLDEPCAMPAPPLPPGA